MAVSVLAATISSLSGSFGGYNAVFPLVATIFQFGKMVLYATFYIAIASDSWYATHDDGRRRCRSIAERVVSALTINYW